MKKFKPQIILIALLALSGCDSVFDEEYITDYEYYPEATEATECSYNEQTEEEAPLITKETASAPDDAPVNHGNAARLAGRTVIVSIFANDTKTSWNYEAENDVVTMYQTLSYLKNAAEWISGQAAIYGKNAEFVYDWEENEDLFYGANFYQEMIREDSSFYGDQKYFIDSYIDSEALMEKYAADNILYMFFFDSDFSNQANPWTSPSPAFYGDYYSTEFINIFVRFDNYHIAPPSTYAHEILHTFGAHDLYYENYAINQAYVDYCTQTDSSDIMYTVSDSEEITNVFSELDAYYTGLLDYSEEAEKWGLLKSEFE